MRFNSRLSKSVTLGLVALSVMSPAQATLLASPDDSALEATSVNAQSWIRAVTLYLGRALVTRVASSPAAAGLFEIRFEGLPASIDSESLQAAVTSPSGQSKVVDVRFESTTTPGISGASAELADAVAKLEAVTRVLSELDRRMEAIKEGTALLAAVRQRIAGEAGRDFGAKAIDPESLRQQLALLNEEYAKLISARGKVEDDIRTNGGIKSALEAKVASLGGEVRCARTAIVSIIQAAAEPSEVELRYLVGDSGWQPRYAVRADLDARSLRIEYDAVVRQSSGEDWSDVELRLSSARPTRKAAPREVGRTIVDVFDPPASQAAAATSEAEPTYATSLSPEFRVMLTAEKSAISQSLSRFMADASAEPSGPIATFAIPRRVSIASDATRSRTLHIGTVDTRPDFTHVARPSVESEVFVKATTVNDSPFQFLPGPMTVFVGSDSVGSATMSSLAPGSEMTFWLGVDSRVTARRIELTKSTGERGVFSKSDETASAYRIDLESTDTKPLTVEVVDSMPVSSDERIAVRLAENSHALSTDPRFTASDKPLGILRWDVRLPACAKAGAPSRSSISWTVTVSAPKDVQVVSLAR